MLNYNPAKCFLLSTTIFNVTMEGPITYLLKVIVMYSASQCLKEIHYLNLSYLLLIQRIFNCDEPAIFSGINAELAKVLQKLSLSKLVALAETNQLLITLRPDIMAQRLGVPTT